MELSVEHDPDYGFALVKKLGIEQNLFLEVVQGYYAQREKELDASVQQGLADFEDFTIPDLRSQIDKIGRLQSERVVAIACADPVDVYLPVDTAFPAIADRVEESRWGAQTSVQSATHVANEESPESSEEIETAENKETEENNMYKVEESLDASAAGLPSWFTDVNYVVPEAPPSAASSCVRRWGKSLSGEAEAEPQSHSWHDENHHNSHDSHPWEGWKREGGWECSDGAGGAGGEGAAGWSDSHWQRDARDARDDRDDRDDRWESRRTSWQSQSWRESTDDWQSGWRNSTWESNDWSSTGWHSNSFSIEYRSRVDVVIFLYSIH